MMVVLILSHEIMSWSPRQVNRRLLFLWIITAFLLLASSAMANELLFQGQAPNLARGCPWANNG